MCKSFENIQLRCDLRNKDCRQKSEGVSVHLLLLLLVHSLCRSSLVDEESASDVLRSVRRWIGLDLHRTVLRQIPARTTNESSLYIRSTPSKGQMDIRSLIQTSGVCDCMSFPKRMTKLYHTTVVSAITAHKPI